MKFSSFLRYTFYSIIVLLAGDNVLFGAQGTKIISNYLGSGLSYITNEYSSVGEGSQQVGLSTASVYTARNGNWLPYPADNRNYLRGDTFLGGTLYDEQNSAYYVNPAGTSTFNKITGGTPTANADLATKEYVDAASGAGGGGSQVCYGLAADNTSTPPSCGSGYNAIQTWAKTAAMSCNMSTKLGNVWSRPVVVNGISYFVTCETAYKTIYLESSNGENMTPSSGDGGSIGYEKLGAITLCCN